ncbi:MAG: YbaB/EbfC family nucleoid-associated protein [Elusimicrobiaceae bacterium]|nr:YbaB/EbfC family nucleoid-associated protein [Elusimicrobiaceae bacterium]
MFDKLGQLKDLWKLKSQMEEIKKRLDNMVIKVDSPRHLVEITISGSQEVKEVRVDALAKNFSEAEIAEDIKAVFNKAVRDSQAMAAQAMGGLGAMPQA